MGKLKSLQRAGCYLAAVLSVALVLLVGSIAWIFRSRRTLVSESPDGRYRVEVRVRTHFPPNRLIGGARGTCVFTVHALENERLDKSKAYAQDFIVTTSSASILAQEAVDCKGPEVTWDLDRCEVRLFFRDYSELSLPLDTRQLGEKAAMDRSLATPSSCR